MNGRPKYLDFPVGNEPSLFRSYFVATAVGSALFYHCQIQTTWRRGAGLFDAERPGEIDFADRAMVAPIFFQQSTRCTSPWLHKLLFTDYSFALIEPLGTVHFNVRFPCSTLHDSFQFVNRRVPRRLDRLVLPVSREPRLCQMRVFGNG